MDQEKFGALILKLVNQNPISTRESPEEPKAELTGLKMAIVPDLETDPLSQLKSLIDISPEAPREIQLKIQNLVHHHQGALGLMIT